MTVTKKVNIMYIDVMTSEGKKETWEVPPGITVRKPKKYVFDESDGTALYLSHYTETRAYSMDIETFIKNAVPVAELEAEACEQEGGN